MPKPSLVQAVQLDTSDGISWSILGNAYFMHFFSVSQNPRTLKQAMSAYKQAVKKNIYRVFFVLVIDRFTVLQEKDVIAKNSPDLYYNKGVVSSHIDGF